MKWLKLSRFANKRSEFLSGGYKRLLNIACSLVNNPMLVFMDEPTVGLDPKMRQLMWEKISALRASGKTILLTTHYMDEAEELCDRVALMSNGEISIIDSPSKLISKYGGKTVIILKLNKNIEPNLLKVVEGAIQGTVARSMHSSLVLSIGQTKIAGSIVKLSALMKLNGYEIKETIVKEPELEDVFLNLTGEGMK